MIETPEEALRAFLPPDMPEDELRYLCDLMTDVFLLMQPPEEGTFAKLTVLALALCAMESAARPPGVSPAEAYKAMIGALKACFDFIDRQDETARADQKSTLQ